MRRLLHLAAGATIAALTYLGYASYERQLQWTVEKSASVSALAWKEFVVSTVPDFEELVATGLSNEAQQESLRVAKATLDVFRFKLFSADGTLTFVSDHLDGIQNTGDALFQHNAEASAVLDAGQPFVSIASGVGKPDRPPHYAEIYAPLVSNGRPIGVVEVYVNITEEMAIIRQSFLRFASVLCALLLLSVAIPTAYWAAAWRQTKKKQQELCANLQHQERLAKDVRLIGDLNEWLQTSRSQSELFTMVSTFLTRLLPACEGEIYMYANSRDVLEGCASWGGGVAKDHVHPEDCWGLRRGRTYSFGEAEIDFKCGHVDSVVDRPYYCMPLLAHGETIGLLHLRQRAGASDEAFRASRRLAQVCSEQISMAFANARMRDELQDQSIRDSLTGLYNRRHLNETLRRQLARANQKGETVAILSLDVDHFKKFNDNHGHDAGDMVLRAVGDVLNRSTDGDDLAFRPGGEEFVIVLSHTNLTDALHKAETIREEIQNISLRYGGKTLPSVTVSIGIALSPNDGLMPQDLLRAADEALYAAKAAGRNQSALTSLIDLGSPHEDAGWPKGGPVAAAE